MSSDSGSLRRAIGPISVSREHPRPDRQVYRRIRNTARFMLASISDFHLANAVPYAELPELELGTDAPNACIGAWCKLPGVRFHCTSGTQLLRWLWVDLPGRDKDILYCDGADSFRGGLNCPL